MHLHVCIKSHWVGKMLASYPQTGTAQPRWYTLGGFASLAMSIKKGKDPPPTVLKSALVSLQLQEPVRPDDMDNSMENSDSECLVLGNEDCLPIQVSHQQGRKSSWTEWMNRTEWIEWRCLVPMPRTKLNWAGSRPDQAGELNWTNSFLAILNWNCVTLTTHHTLGVY